MGKRRIFIVAGIAINLLVLSGCAEAVSETIQRENNLAQKGISIQVSEESKATEDYDKLVASLDLFFSDFSKVDTPVVISDKAIKGESNNVPIGTDLALSYDEYFEVYTKTLGEHYDYGISTSVVSNIIEGVNPEPEADYPDFFSKEENTYLLDFTLPEMEDIFVSKENAEITKDAAKRFCAFVKDAYGADKLLELSKSAEDDEEKVRIKNEWLKSIGATAEYAPAAAFFFKKNELKKVDEYPYYIPSNSYNLFIALNDIKDKDYREFFRTYQATAKYWEGDLKNAREAYFGYDKEVRTVNMYTMFTSDNLVNNIPRAGEYFNDEIKLFQNFDAAVLIFLHEYTHHLQCRSSIYAIMNRRDMQRVMNEGYAIEYDEYEYERKAYTSTLSEDTINHPILWNNEEKTYDFGTFNDMKAHFLQIESGVAYGSVSYIEEVSSPEIAPIEDLSYCEIGSFVHYLRETKGDEAFKDAFGDFDKFAALYDNDYEGTYRKWQKYLEERLREKGVTDEYIYDKFGYNL